MSDLQIFVNDPNPSSGSTSWKSNRTAFHTYYRISITTSILNWTRNKPKWLSPDLNINNINLNAGIIYRTLVIPNVNGSEIYYHVDQTLCNQQLGQSIYITKYFF